MAMQPSAPAPMQPGAAPGAPADADGEGAEPATITITDNGDGTYSIEQGDAGDDAEEGSTPGGAGASGPDSEQPPVTVQSVADVLHVVKQMLGQSGDPKAAWNAEASSRDASGMPAQGGAGGPPMSM